MMSKKAVYDYIDRSFEEHVAKVQELIRQPSISPEGKGVRECAQLLRGYFEQLGCSDARLVETSGNPVVYGEYNAGAKKTVLVYMMYDTMPVDEPDWTVPPLGGRIIDMPPFGETLVARGAVNTKGELRAFLNACESIRAAEQELPVNMIFVAEGEEEMGSRNLPEFIQSYREKLKRADVVFFPLVAQNQKGKVIVELGVKGIVYFELEIDGKDWRKGPTEFGIHGSNKSWVDSPVWRMMQALSTMTSKDGNKVLIEEFYDDVVPPPPEDEELLKKLERTFDEDAIKEELKVKRFIQDLHGVEALKQYLYAPQLNIDGIWGGYTGPGTKTLLPHKITVKMDVRLVPNMSKEKPIPLIRKHLDKHEFNEVKIRILEKGYDWAKTSVRTPAAQAVIKTYKEFGHEPEVWPNIAGSAPFSMFNRPPLNLPFVMGGLGHGARAHSPNEYLVIGEGGPTAGLATMEKSFVSMLYNLAEI